MGRHGAGESNKVFTTTFLRRAKKAWEICNEMEMWQRNVIVMRLCGLIRWQDPTLLVELKATRNTVPVPRHWCQKRKFLQGKRGIEKPPWQLPEFIEATGISTMRQVPCAALAAAALPAARPTSTRGLNTACVSYGRDAAL